MSLYRVTSRAAAGLGVDGRATDELMVAVRLQDVASPLRSGGPLAAGEVPWARAWVPASARACGDWRNALGPEPLEELQDIVLRASRAGH